MSETVGFFTRPQGAAPLSPRAQAVGAAVEAAGGAAQRGSRRAAQPGGSGGAAPAEASRSEAVAEVAEVEAALGRPQLWTARFTAPALAGSGLVAVRTSNGFPRFRLRYALTEAVKELLPDWSTMNWPEERFAAAYRAKLDAAGPAFVAAALAGISHRHEGRGLALLCFEDVRKPGVWCHRQLLAAWLRDRLGWVVEELPEQLPNAPEQGQLLA